ncbi:MAG: hypothetical protein ACE366_15930 [Bradymonadia bacterium]
MKRPLAFLLTSSVALTASAGEPDSQAEPDPYAPTYGKRMTFVADYEVTPLPGGKRFQPVLLHRESGLSPFIRSYRPVPEEFKFANRRVEVTGRPYTPSPMTQHVTGEHFEVESITLVPWQTPNESVDGIPTPFTVMSAHQIGLRLGRWSRYEGTLKSVDVSPEGEVTARMHMAEDNAEIIIGPVTRGPKRVEKWRPLIGQQVTLIGRARADEGGQLRVPGNVAMCKGKDLRCGLDTAGKGKKKRLKPKAP